MREKLKQSTNEMTWYTGFFSRLGLKSKPDTKHKASKITPTICLQNVTNEQGELVADHIWFNYTSPFYSLGEAQSGDAFNFYSKPEKYHKGPNKSKYDIKLKQPRQVKLIANHEVNPLPTDKDAIVGYVMSVTGHRDVGNYSSAYHKWAFDRK